MCGSHIAASVYLGTGWKWAHPTRNSGGQAANLFHPPLGDADVIIKAEDGAVLGGGSALGDRASPTLGSSHLHLLKQIREKSLPHAEVAKIHKETLLILIHVCARTPTPTPTHTVKTVSLPLPRSI